jgi:hypothetical protein
MKEIKEKSKSLIEVEKRYNIAKKFNFEISTDGIRWTKDVLKFIKDNKLILNNSKTKLSLSVGGD